MTAERLNPDRFNEATYANDPKVGIFVGEPRKEIWIPERLFDRMRLIAAAYGLHILPLLDGTADILSLDYRQVAVLRDELTFIGELVPDPLMVNYLAPFMELAADAAWRGGVFRIERP